MHQCHEDRLSFHLVFADALDALRFCIVTQVALLYEDWPQEGVSGLGGTVVGLDNKLLFRGPRMALALVASAEYTCVCLCSLPFLSRFPSDACTENVKRLGFADVGGAGGWLTAPHTGQ